MSDSSLAIQNKMKDNKYQLVYKSLKLSTYCQTKESAPITGTLSYNILTQFEN